MLSAMDDAVGRVLDALEAAGVQQQTLVFFLSDNGGHPDANAASNLPLRGQKSSVYEGGIRVPFVVTWPARLPAGTVYERPVSGLDIVPTALAAAGVMPPAERPLDGVDLVPYLTGEMKSDPHETLFWRYGEHRAVRKGDWKLTVPREEPAALYNLAEDISEARDRSADHPEIVRDLQQEFARWNEEVEPPRWPDLFQRRNRK
jgi:arylsulfatase A-like enzyme